MRCPFPVRGLRGVLYSTRVMDTYLDTCPMKESCVIGRTQPSIAALQSAGRVNSITSPLQMMQFVGRIEFLDRTGARGLT